MQANIMPGWYSPVLAVPAALSPYKELSVRFGWFVLKNGFQSRTPEQFTVERNPTQG
jgi:hypothetical protein